MQAGGPLLSDRYIYITMNEEAFMLAGDYMYLQVTYLWWTKHLQCRDAQMVIGTELKPIDCMR